MTEADSPSPDTAILGGHAPSGVMPSWERRDELGIWTAGWKSVWELLIQRDRTFSALPLEGDLYGPLLYGLAVGGVGIWLCLAGFFLFCNPQFFLFSIEQSQTAVMHLSYIAIAGIASPIVLCLWMIVVSIFCHGILKRRNPSVRLFASTVRVMSYGMATSCLFIGLPVIFWIGAVIVLKLMDSRIGTLGVANADANQIVAQILAIQSAIGITRKLYLLIHCMCAMYGLIWLTGAVKSGLRQVHSLPECKTTLALVPVWSSTAFLWYVVYVYALVIFS